MPPVCLCCPLARPPPLRPSLPRLTPRPPLRSVVGLLAFTIPFSVYMAYVESTHESHHERVAHPHLKIRSKKFPWASSDCDIFDSECKKNAKLAAQ